MRVFRNFAEARSEIRRDLAELGTKVFAGYQSKSLSELDEEFLTMELTDYDYIILNPRQDELNPTQPWADAEWNERLAGILHSPVNPGEAWQLRPEVWKDLIETHAVGTSNEAQMFSYTYSQRFHEARVDVLVRRMKENPQSRQIYVSIWNPDLDAFNMGHRRVPCTLGYQLMMRKGKLDISYMMRSSDFSTHWENDLYLTMRFQEWFANQLSVEPGRLTHKVGSLHVYHRDVADVF